MDMGRWRATAALGLLLAPAFAHAQLYLSGDFGAASAAGPVMEGHDNDRGGVCDEFINPLFADVPGCNDAAAARRQLDERLRQRRERAWRFGGWL